MTKFISKHKLLFTILVIIDVLFILLSVIHIKYDVTTPAYIDSIEDVITISDQADLNGSINVVSVYSYEKVNLLSYVIARLNPYADVSKTYEYYDLSRQDAYKGGVIQKRVSLYNSVIAGYKKAGYELNYTYIGEIVHLKQTFADEDFEIGDIITHVEGKELSNNYSLSDAIKENRDKIVNGKEHALTMTIIKNYGDLTSQKASDYLISTKEFDDNGSKSYGFGIGVYAYNIPSNTSGIPDFVINWNRINSIGPSGGLLQSFYVYEKLTGAHLSSNLKIAGTGTVDVSGNAGPIGGIGQKIITAEHSGVDIFFVPVLNENYENNPDESNYIEAIEAYNKLKSPHMKLVPVWSLDGIISYLMDYQGV